MTVEFYLHVISYLLVEFDVWNIARTGTTHINFPRAMSVNQRLISWLINNLLSTVVRSFSLGPIFDDPRGLLTYIHGSPPSLTVKVSYYGKYAHIYGRNRLINNKGRLTKLTEKESSIKV